MPAPSYTEDDIRQAVEDLGDVRPLVRQAAEEQLREIGEPALSAMIAALQAGIGGQRMSGLMRLFCTLGDVAVPALEEALTCSSGKEQRAASLALERIGTPLAREALVNLLPQRGPEPFVAPPSAWAAESSAVLVVSGGFFVTFLLLLGKNESGGAGWAFALFIASLLAAAAMHKSQEAFEPLPPVEVHALQACSDPAMVNAITPWVTHPDTKVQQAAREALARCLDGLDAGSAAPITARSRRTLFACLDETDVPICMAVLKAIPLIATADALAPVTRLATGRAPCAVEAEVRRAARERLPLVREIANQSQLSERLVRASQGDTEQLLRPAAGARPDTDHLVRPAATHQAAPAEQSVRSDSKE